MGRVKLGTFFSLPEEEFREYIKEIEGKEFFQDLLNKYRIVRYRKFSGVQPLSSLEFKEELTPGDSFDLLELIEKDPRSWQIVRRVAVKIGEERFSRLLRGNDGISFSEIFQEGDLSPQEAEKFKDFINSFQLRESFFAPPSSSASFSRPHLCPVARIENREGELFILPLDDFAYLVKGRYVIDYEHWEDLVRDRQIPPDKIKNISSLFHRLDMINRRTTTLYQIIYQIKEKQRKFLLSGDSRDMFPFNQRQMAGNLGVNPSTISRAIAGKSLITPWGIQKALKEFFSGEKEKIKKLMLEVIREETRKLREGILTHPLSDEEIREKLKEIFQVQVARRTVTKYRRELKLPSSKKRRVLTNLA